MTGKTGSVGALENANKLGQIGNAGKGATEGRWKFQALVMHRKEPA